MTFVRIVTGDPRVALERLVPFDPGPAPSPWNLPHEPEWQQVCVTPCVQPIPVNGDYRIGGRGITPSDPFKLHAPRTDLDVNAGSGSAHNAGIYFTVLGLLAATASGIFLGVSASNRDPGAGPSNHAFAIGSGIGLGVGGLMTIVGAGLWIGTGTSVKDVPNGARAF
jgi:hypothetical protein